MAKLLVHESGGETREFELVDAEVHIGRELDNTLRLPDPSISRHHCVVRRTPNGFEIQDLQSSNGVLVNGVRVQTNPLRHGDRLTLGQIQMSFQNPQDEGATVAIKAGSVPEAPSAIGTVRMSADEMAALHGSPSGADAARSTNPVMLSDVPASKPSPAAPPPPAAVATPPMARPAVPPVAPPPPTTSSPSPISQGAPMSGGTIHKPDANPVLALLLTWFVLGTGHYFINGQQRKWIYTLVAGLIGTLLCCIPGFVIGICSVIDAYQTAERLQKGETIGENEYTFPFLFKIMSKFDKEATCSRA